MNIEYLPSQLHLNYNSKVDLELLTSCVEEIFPDANDKELVGDTLNIYNPSEGVEFIHVSTKKIGVVFSSGHLTEDTVSEVWESVGHLVDKLAISKISKLSWEVKSVYRVETKEDLRKVAGKLSPIPEYGATSLTLRPVEKKQYYVRLSLVSKDKSEFGILINFIYESSGLEKKELLDKLSSLVGDLDVSGEVKAISSKVLGL